jgi:hypothetical protein
MGSSSSHKIAIVLPQQSRPSLFGPGRPRLASVGVTSQAAIGAFLGTDAEVKGRLWAVPAVRPALPAAGRALPSRTPITGITHALRAYTALWAGTGSNRGGFPSAWRGTSSSAAGPNRRHRATSKRII